MPAQVEPGFYGDPEWERVAANVHVPRDLTKDGRVAFFGAIERYSREMSGELERTSSASDRPIDLTRTHVEDACKARLANAILREKVKDRQRQRDRRVLGGIFISAGSLAAPILATQTHGTVLLSGLAASVVMNISGYFLTWRGRGDVQPVDQGR